MAGTFSSAELVLRLLSIIILLALGAFWAASEIALIRISKVRARNMAEKGVKNAGALTDLLEEPNRFLSAILLLSLLTQVGASALATSTAQIISEKYAAVFATLIMTVFMFVFAEMAPKIYATSNSDNVALRVARLIRFLTKLFYPFTKGLTKVSELVIKAFGGSIDKVDPFITEDDLIAMVSAAEEERVIEEEEKEMIHSIFSFIDTLAREVMVPRTDMTALPSDVTMHEAIETFKKTGYSRIPIYQEKHDNIVGILYAKDVFFHTKDGWESVRPVDIAREPFFMPETKPVSSLLNEMRNRKTHMAIVLDEYGGTAGLVTIEDLIEEIVGEIFDEYDKETILIEELSEKVFRVDAKLPVGDLNELIGVKFPSSEWDSVGGLMYTMMGKVPREGESIEMENVRFVAERVTGRRIYKVLVEKKGESAQDSMPDY